MSGARYRIGFRKLREANFLFTNWRIPIDPTAAHAIEKYFCLLRPLGILTIPDSVEIFVPEEKKNAVDRFFEDNGLAGAKVVAVNPGASWPNKRPAPEKYAAAIDALADSGARPVLVWGPGKSEWSMKS